jgi:V8-like Glu-specific endopeptidase
MAAARPAEELAPAAGVRFTRPGSLDTYLHRLAPGRGTPEVPEPGAPWAGGGLVARTTGKVFFTVGADDYVCSGSAVDSPDRSTVLTAGHCVVDPESGTSAKNWIFVPGYASGKAPYGIFPATHLTTTTAWRSGEDFDVDVAFANVGPNAAGQRLDDVVGGQSIAFDVARGQTTWVFGYPAVAPWTGEQLVHCSGVVVPDTTPVPSTDQGLACTMTPGSSGGPWFSGFDSRTGRGTLTSLTSFSYSDQPGVLWGPYLGSVAHTLYDAVASTTSA